MTGIDKTELVAGPDFASVYFLAPVAGSLNSEVILAFCPSSLNPLPQVGRAKEDSSRELPASARDSLSRCGVYEPGGRKRPNCGHSGAEKPSRSRSFPTPTSPGLPTPKASATMPHKWPGGPEMLEGNGDEKANGVSGH